MTSPYIPWPGADGNLTANMWAWWFGASPQHLGPVPLVDPPDHNELGRGGGGGGGRGGGGRGGRGRWRSGRGWERDKEDLYCVPGDQRPECDVRLEGMGGIQPREVPILGADLYEKPTPPPCSAGYIPIIDRGVLKCTPGYQASGMVNMTPVQRTFPVTAYYGWKQG